MMRNPSLAAAYAAIYPRISTIAQKHGYALALHGSMARDFDLIAVPWTETASEPEPMIRDIMDHLGLCFYPELLARQGLTEEQITQIVERTQGDGRERPHGRRSWSLHLCYGAYIDLSVMPLKAAQEV